MKPIRPRIFRLSAVLAVVMAIAAGTAGDAGAASGPVAGGPGGTDICSSQAAAVRVDATVETLRAFGDCEIARRLTTLAQLTKAVNGSKTLTPADARALNRDIAAASTELGKLKINLDSQVSVVGIKATLIQIVTKVRVYVLVGPQVRLTIAAADVLSIGPHVAALTSSLADRIDTARAAGKDVTAAAASLAAMRTSLADAQSLAQPWPSQLVSLTPAEWDSGAAAPVLRQARTDLGNALAQLKAALADGRAILKDLR